MPETIVSPGSAVSGQEDPEYIQKMLDRAEGGNLESPPATPTTPTETPTLLAGKYKTVEELEKGYTELQKAFSGRNPAPADAAAAKSEDAQGEPAAAPADSAELPPKVEPTNSEGIDFDRYTESFLKTGSLSEDDYKELETKHKLPKAAVDIYVAGLKSQSDARGKAAIAAVGDAETFEKVRRWASESLESADYLAVQSAIQNAQTDADVALVYKTLHVRYSEANPAEPSLLTGRSGETSVAGFRSRAEMTAAINDPRYERDDAYRADVERKIGASNIF